MSAFGKLSFKCPSCNKNISVASHLAGKKVRCTCGQKILIPAEVTPPVAAPETVSPIAAFALQPLPTLPAKLAEVPPLPVLATRIIEDSPIACPSCGSENWKSLSLIYESGTSSTSAGIVGGGLGGVGGGAIYGKTLTALASRAAPPPVPSLHNLFGVGGVISFIYGLNGHLEFIVLGILSCVLWGYLHSKLTKSHEEAMRIWNRMKACERCGCFF